MRSQRLTIYNLPIPLPPPQSVVAVRGSRGYDTLRLAATRGMFRVTIEHEDLHDLICASAIGLA